MGVQVHFSLSDKGFLARINVFYRVFHRDDMNSFFSVDHVDERGDRSGFSVPGRTGNQNKTLAQFSKVPQNLWQVKLFQIWNFVGDQTQRCREIPLLVKGVDPKASHFAKSK